MNFKDKPEDKSIMEGTSQILDTLIASILSILLSQNANNVSENLKICKINSMYKEYDNIYSNIASELKNFCDLNEVRRPYGSCHIFDEFNAIMSEDLCDKYLINICLLI